VNANSYSSPGITGGNREWMDSTLTILEPEETPFTALVPKSNDAKGTFHEVLADRLRAARVDGSKEGDSGPKGGNKATKRQRFGSYLHRWFDSFGVTDVQQAVTEAGGNAVTTDEFALAKSKCLRELKRDMEGTHCSAIETTTGGAADMKERGAFTWLAATQTPAIPADFITPAAQRLTGKVQLSETDLNSVLKSLKSNYGGSREYHLIGGNDYVEDIDLYTRAPDGLNPATGGRATYIVASGEDTHEISMLTKVFQTSFGRVVVHGSDFLRIDSVPTGDPTAALILNMEHWEACFLEKLHTQDEFPDAGGFAGFAKCIGGLFCRMPRGSGYVYNT
jgi:hypothetical protein